MLFLVVLNSRLTAKRNQGGKHRRPELVPLSGFRSLRDSKSGISYPPFSLPSLF
jgi:hypothetical protein